MKLKFRDVLRFFGNVSQKSWTIFQIIFRVDFYLHMEPSAQTAVVRAVTPHPREMCCALSCQGAQEIKDITQNVHLL